MRWDNLEEKIVIGLEMLKDVEEWIVKIIKNLKATQDR
jgi:hypothetical protein